MFFKNAASGAAAEAATGRILRSAGLEPVSQVSFRLPSMRLSRADFVAKTASNQIKVIESKSGNASLTSNQQELRQAVLNGTAVPVGRNVAAAGLLPGVPLSEQTSGTATFETFQWFQLPTPH